MKQFIKTATSLLLTVLSAFSILGIIPATAVVSDADINLALGKEVTFGYKSEVTTDVNWGINVVNSGLSVLTDGEKDNTTWAVNNGNPYIGLKSSIIEGPYNFILDLGEAYPISQAGLYFYTRTDWNVKPTESVKYSVSEDGVLWREVGTISSTDAVASFVDSSNVISIYNFLLSFEATNAQYIKAEFENSSNGIIGIGEFEVYTTNLAYGKNVSFEYGSQLSTDANWDATAVTNGLNSLTNGINDAPNFWVNNSTTDPAQSNPYIGLNQAIVTGPYAFIVDLGQLTSVGKIQSYFYDRTDWNVAVPTTVTYSVSSDGTTWAQAGTVASKEASTKAVYDENNPAEQQPTIYNFCFSGSFDNIRYVKVSFEAHSNTNVKIGFGEIEIFEATEGYSYEISNDQVTITDYIGKDAELEIPVELNGYPVVAIADNAFGKCTELKNVVVPDTIEIIGSNTFAYATKITIYNPNCVIRGKIGADIVTLSSYNNSTTQTYATENNVAFELIECPNHIWNNGEVVKSETCTENGEELYTCKLCKETKSLVIPATGHTKADEWIIIREEGCETTGKKALYCTVCEEVLETIETPATGHLSTGEWIAEKHPNCVETGLMVDLCIICGNVSATKETPATGHAEVINLAVNASYFENGYTGNTTCSECETVLNKGTFIPKKILQTPKFNIKSKNKKFTVKYKKVTDASGFIVKYKHQGKAVTKKIKTEKATKVAFKNLAKGTYKVKVRAYIEADGQTAYSKWTKTEKIRIK